MDLEGGYCSVFICNSSYVIIRHPLVYKCGACIVIVSPELWNMCTSSIKRDYFELRGISAQRAGIKTLHTPCSTPP